MKTNNRNDLEDSILQERIRQAKLSFNLAAIFTAIGSVITIAGAVVAFTGHPEKGVYTAIGGGASTAISSRWMQMARDANDRLDKLQAHMDEDEDGD